MTPVQKAIREDIEAYEALEESLRKALAVFNDPKDRVGLIGLVRRYNRVLDIICKLQEMENQIES